MEGLHVHLSVLQLFVLFLGLIPFFFFWRVLASYLAAQDHPLGAAMSFIF